VALADGNRAMAARLGAGDSLRSAEWRRLEARDLPASGPVALASRSHRDAETDAFLARRGVADIRSAGSSLKFVVLARGEADLYPRFGRTMEWDTAAGHAVLSAAGGAVVTADGAELAYGKRSVGYANPPFVAWGRRPVAPAF
jgi:3'(2'), 5'-bisphosphate nucleotidase